MVVVSKNKLRDAMSRSGLKQTPENRKYRAAQQKSQLNKINKLPGCVRNTSRVDVASHKMFWSSDPGRGPDWLVGRGALHLAACRT